jgi:hypothetical protein
MFRKIHSSRDPRDTLANELKKEFRPYLETASKRLRVGAERCPKLLFGVMVVGIVISAALSFTLFRPAGEVPRARPQLTKTDPVSAGFDRLLEAGTALKEMIAIKKQIDSLSAKKVLSEQDSVALDKALDKFQTLNHQFNHAH